MGLAAPEMGCTKTSRSGAAIAIAREGASIGRLWGIREIRGTRKTGRQTLGERISFSPREIPRAF